MSSLGEIVNFIRPPDGTDTKANVRWRWNITLVLLVMIGFMAWSLTPWGFALADVIDERIDVATETLRENIAQMREVQSEQGRQLQAIKELAQDNRAEIFEARIVEYKSRMCDAETPDGRHTWRLLVLDYQNRYLRLTGSNYAAPACTDL